MSRSYNPRRALRRRGFGLLPVRSPLLGESLLFSLPAGTKMFQFPAFAHRSEPVWQAFSLPGFPIRRSADHRSCAPPRGLSQLITSFIAGKSQGIHRTPLVTFPRPCRMKMAPSRAPRQDEYTFGCTLKCLVYLIFACLIMSKIACRARGACPRGGTLRAPRAAWWRITDSNR